MTKKRVLLTFAVRTEEDVPLGGYDWLKSEAVVIVSATPITTTTVPLTAASIATMGRNCDIWP